MFYRARMADYLTRLNAEQREAVESLDGPLLVLAGAVTSTGRKVPGARICCFQKAAWVHSDMDRARPIRELRPLRDIAGVRHCQHAKPVSLPPDLA